MRSLSTMIAVIVIALACAPARGQSLQEQALCAQQAQKAFEEYHRADRPGNDENKGIYESHYNTKLNRCLILITLGDYAIQDQDMIILMDAIERHVFALLLWNNRGVNVIQCALTPTVQAKDDTFCRNRGDFDAFVAKYMEQ